jgi:DNA primase
VRSSELLVTEGFQVNVALLPEGSDPDTYIRNSGSRAYVERLTGSRPYLEFVLDRAAERLDLSRPDSRRTFLNQMLGVAAGIPDAAARDQFADRLAHKARITETVVRDEIRKAAAERRREAPAVAVPVVVRMTPAEQGLLWALVHRPVEGLAGVARLDLDDLEGVVAAPIFRLAATLADVPPDVLPSLLGERLNEGERALLQRAAGAEAPVAPAADCVTTLRRLRYARERAAIQEEIDRLQDRQQAVSDEALASLWERKKAVLRRIEE